MSTLTKFATTGALALSLATAGLGTAPAHADGRGGAGIGLGIGLVTGLIIGDAITNAHPHRRYDPGYAYDNAGYGPVCHPGRLQWRWQEICDPDGYCRNVKTYFRPEVCN